MEPDEVDLGPWKRLGEMLTARRIELDPRNQNRRRFADRVRINYRVLFDIEQGKRANYGPNMLAAVERAYGWRAGSIERVLNGGDPQPVTTVGPVTPMVDSSRDVFVPADVPIEDLEPWKQHIWFTPELTVEERQVLISVVWAMRSRADVATSGTSGTSGAPASTDGP